MVRNLLAHFLARLLQFAFHQVGVLEIMLELASIKSSMGANHFYIFIIYINKFFVCVKTHFVPNQQQNAKLS